MTAPECDAIWRLFSAFAAPESEHLYRFLPKGVAGTEQAGRLPWLPFEGFKELESIGGIFENANKATTP